MQNLNLDVGQKIHIEKVLNVKQFRKCSVQLKLEVVMTTITIT